MKIENIYENMDMDNIFKLAGDKMKCKAVNCESSPAMVGKRDENQPNKEEFMFNFYCWDHMSKENKIAINEWMKKEME